VHLPEDVQPGDVAETFGPHSFLAYDELLVLLEGSASLVY